MNLTLDKAVLMQRIARKIERAADRCGNLPAPATQAAIVQPSLEEQWVWNSETRVAAAVVSEVPQKEYVN